MEEIQGKISSNEVLARNRKRIMMIKALTNNVSSDKNSSFEGDYHSNELKKALFEPFFLFNLVNECI